MNRSNSFSPNNPPAGGPGASPPSGTPDTQWASVFQDASAVPPARVWSGIERQLDLDDEDGVLPLYPQVLSRSVLFGRWMAGIAATGLLALFGWWTIRSNPATPLTTNTVATTGSITQPVQKDHLEATVGHAVAKAEAASRQKAVAKTDYVPGQSRKKNQSGQFERAGDPIANSVQPVENLTIELTPGGLVQPNATVEITITESVAVMTQARPMPRSMATNELPVRSFAQARSSFFAQAQPVQASMISPTAGSVMPPATATLLPPPGATSNASVAVAAPVNNRAVADQLSGLQTQLASSVEPLLIRPFVAQRVGNNRIVWFSPEQPTVAPAQKTARKARAKAWVSAGIVASSFNPSVALRAVSGLAYANNSPTPAMVAGGPIPALALDSHAGRAVAVQANVGIPLSDRWTLETGVGYLTAQSTVQSPVRITSLSANITNMGIANGATLYTDLIGGSTSNSAAYDMSNQYSSTTQRAALVANSSYDRSASQSINNNYQFVQVPVQVSYELRPRRKFGLALLTGLVSNLFVRNTVDALTVKAQDNVYKPLTLAGTAGMRLRFRPDKQWSASVAGLFQQSFQSITRADVGVQAVPQSMGVSFSVDRQF